jgi:hypothetical protein
MYAALYYAIHKLRTLLCKYIHFLLLYKRYIDDVLSIWNTSLNPNGSYFAAFSRNMDRWGKLRWEISPLVNKVNFLDVTLTITPSGHVDSRLFKKALNLYLYLPSYSCHPPGVLKGLLLKGLLYGSIFQILRLTTDRAVCQANIQDLFCQLLQRGYQAYLHRRPRP